MQVTVKTLDSETRTFTVSEELTVEEFKKEIADTVGIPAERQRLIFKGKVLQDEKKLKEFEVDGCVVHLVERKPPRTQPDGASNSPDGPSVHPGSQAASSAANIVMGAFNMPVDVMGISQNIVQGLVSHLGVDASHANVSSSHSSDGSTLNVHINLLSAPPEGNDAARRLSRARHFIRAARESFNRTEGEAPPSMDANVPTDDRPAPNQGPQGNTEQPRPSDLADVLGELQEFSSQLQPSLNRYTSLLNSPATENLLPSDDSLPDRIAETLHNLSHAYHALSDLSINIRAPEPRRLSVLTPLSPHVGAPNLLSSIFGGRPPPGPTTSRQNVSGQAGPTNMTQSSTSHSSTPRHHGEPQTTISITSIISSAIPRGHMPTTPSTTPQATPPSTTPQTTAPTASQAPSAGETPQSSTATTGEEARVMMDDFVNLISNLGQMTHGHPAASASQGAGQTGLHVHIGPRPPMGPPPPPGFNLHTGPRLHMGPPPSGFHAQRGPQPEMGPTPQPHPYVPPMGPIRVNPMQAHRQGMAHPDPSLPCESFHFGLRAHRAQPSQQPGSAPTQGTQQSESTPAQGTQQSGSSSVEGPGRVFEQLVASVVQNAVSGGAALAQQAQRNTANAGTNTSTSTTAGTQTTRPGGDSVVQSLMDLLSGIQGQSPQPPPSTASQQEGEGDTHALRDAVMRDLVLNAYNQAIRGQPQTAYQTLNDVILELQNRGLDTSSEPISIQGALLSQLITRIGTSLSMQDMLGIMLGLTPPCLRLRVVLRSYLFTDLLLGEEATESRLQELSVQFVSQVLDEIAPILTSESTCDGIDVVATVRKFLEYFSKRAFTLIRDADEQTFCNAFPFMVRGISSDFVQLLALCYQNGLRDVENIITNRLPGTIVARDMGPVMLRTFRETLLRYVRDASQVPTQTNLQDYIIKPVCQPDTTEDMSQNSDDSFHTPPGSVVTGGPEASQLAIDQGEVHMDVDDLEDDWKAVVPEEWVPILAQDVMRQRRIPPQQPFSDAYLSGLPPKRRKTADERAVCPTDEVLPGIIRQAMLATGAPRNSIDAVTESARTNSELHQAYREEVKETVKKRTDTDTDFSSERFPITSQYTCK
ncbi:large proline-rich protein bag6-like isoform X2 [Nematostella vectensis]|uniref:large proline-rich protein bag6-like isoform X2 n=1 Tax=Nematostella vectensis TaxID=45351 RepID=UPI002076FACF|nr:large proline-rich protein bag6-like isoform X2 [Nematostella vectensis]